MEIVGMTFEIKTCSNEDYVQDEVKKIRGLKVMITCTEAARQASK